MPSQAPAELASAWKTFQISVPSGDVKNQVCVSIPCLIFACWMSAGGEDGIKLVERGEGGKGRAGRGRSTRWSQDRS